MCVDLTKLWVINTREGKRVEVVEIKCLRMVILITRMELGIGVYGKDVSTGRTY